jgi:signal transduction histidine kinase/DNA-binding response OmpR family regulator/HPt (histidine-containing phosphotransfer) domain-containing protein
MIPQFEELGRAIAGLQIPDEARERLAGLWRDAEKQVKAYEFRLDRAEKHKSALNTLIQGIKADYEEEQEKVNAATRAKSDFLARMSHEIRTPMNAIIGLSHLALRTELSPKQEDYVGKILSSSQSLLGIINDILDFSKIEAGKLSLESVPFRLDEVLDNVANQVALRAAEKGLEFLLSIEPDVPLGLCGDPLRLGQVLLNLASNAIKFTQAGEVVITVSAGSSALSETAGGAASLRFSVRDTGIGLSPEQRARLFQSFSQADGSTTRKYGGTGLGLVICQRLAQMMGGDIGVDSVEGLGSTFWFTVTCALPESGVGAPAFKALPQGMRDLRVLVVDDNATARDILCRMVSQFGWRADAAASGDAALGLLDQAGAGGYDLVILDWKMPGPDGVQTAEAIRARGLSPMPKLLMVSAFGQGELLREGKRDRFDGFLAKPVGLSALHNAVMEAYGHEAVRRTVRESLAELRPDGLEAVRGGRILLVEDNEINQQIAIEILGLEGFWVSVAGDGMEALDILAEETRDFDLVLMDLQMPRMDGFMATREIRRLGYSLPIVAMTADAVSGVELQCRTAGMDDFITKPIDPRELLLALTRWIKPGTRTVFAGPPDMAGPAGSLPELPGLDVAGALARVGGRVGSYRKLLERFFRSHGRDLAVLREALGRGEMEAARRLAHTLKGVAGTIGATGLHKACLEVENALRSDPAGLEPRLGAAEGEMRAVLATLGKLVSATGPTEGGPEGPADRAMPDDSALAPLLARLRSQLTENEGRALRTCAELKELLQGTAAAAAFGLIESALDEYDYDRALALLDESGF